MLATTNSNITLAANRDISLTNIASALFQDAGTTLSVLGPISSTGNGLLTKTWAGDLILSGANTYSGGTHVDSGTLLLSGINATLGTGDVSVDGLVAVAALGIESGVTNAIGDAAMLNLTGGGIPDVADRGYLELGGGIIEVVGSLVLNGVSQPNGTYGSTASDATFKLNEFFSGTGILQVGPLDPLLPGDFNDDGIVDAADYALWRRNIGQPAGTLPNDTTGEVIGDGQYNLWAGNFGSTSGVGGNGQVDGGAVPEPSAIAILLFAFSATGGRLFRRSVRRKCI